MKTYRASRWASGNRLFPSTIGLGDDGVHIHDPSLFSGVESTTPYARIASVKVERPMIGFSTVIFDVTGADCLGIHGFTAEQAQEIKSEILKRMA